MSAELPEEVKYTLDDLLYLVTRLREPETGCPWDIEQTYSTIVPHTLEEVYEVVDAIEKSDYVNLKEELGDLLLQIMLYAQFAKEEERFSFAGVVSDLVTKLIRRHPHVFPDGTLKSRIQPTADMTADRVRHNWEQIKAAEKQAAQVTKVGEEQPEKRWLDDVPTTLPAIQRAQKLQKRASKVGFDWNSVSKVLEKLDEEIGELKALLNPSEGDVSILEGDLTPEQQQVVDAKREQMAAELGDIMFVCVNVARHLKIDPEGALRKTNLKFINRFDFIESNLSERKISLQDASLEEMEYLWQLSKRRLDKSG